MSVFEIKQASFSLLGELAEIESFELSDCEPSLDELSSYISSETLNSLIEAKEYIESNLEVYSRFRNRVVKKSHVYKGFHSRYHTCLKLIQALELAGVERSFSSFYDICFAPGAFTEGLFRLYSIDEAYGITLIDKGLEIDSSITSNPRFRILSPEDGNLYNYSNLLEAKAISVDLVCADGGFEVKNENLQSLYVYPLIFCEFVHAINTLKQGGVFVCKLFDTFDERTVQAIAALSLYFKHMYITKPPESRLVNSERYLVAIDFDSSSLEALSFHLEDMLRMKAFKSPIFEAKLDSEQTEFGKLSEQTEFGKHSDFISSIKAMNEAIAQAQANEIRRVVDECKRLGSKNQHQPRNQSSKRPVWQTRRPRREHASRIEIRDVSEAGSGELEREER